MKRKIVKAEVQVTRNVSVYARCYLSRTGGKATFDIAVPDHEQDGFYLKHLKTLTVEEVIALHKVLGDVLAQYEES